MRVVKEFPHEVKVIEHVWIPLPDGGRLAAKIWMPKEAEKKPVPALLEYIPYRKRDFTRARDSVTHPYLAGHGYACVRVDLRGSGESSGVLLDEYLEQEQADGVFAIDWISRQPWCDGSVGMFGISWGGFNSLQVAARRPKALKAIVSACSTDDLYNDNMHYMGGCLLSDNLSESTVMLAFNSLPPDPSIVGDAWRDMWFERLEKSGFWIDPWLKHQRRSEYWHGGSICENYDALDCPVMLVSGWTDGYTNAVFRMLENLKVPRLGLVGPWSHKYPHLGEPGPAIGFLQEMLRWWDYWLKGKETGIMEEPMLRAYMQDSVPPTTKYAFRPGRWVGENSWPSTRINWLNMPIYRGRLNQEGERPPIEEMSIQSPLTVGLFAGKWCSYAATPDLPHDQRQEDGGAMVFETDEFNEYVEVLGSPKARLEVSADRPNAMVAARISDVAPDGSATRVSFGLLNLTHRDGNAKPKPLIPGQKYKVCIELNNLAHSFPPGHKLRLSLSTSYWPLAWPSPNPAKLRFFSGHSSLDLPIRPPSGSDQKGLAFGPAEGSEPLPLEQLSDTAHNWKVIRDLARDKSTLEVINDDGSYRIAEIDLNLRKTTKEWYSTVANDFASARGETRTVRALERRDWKVRIDTRTVLTCDSRNFYVRSQVDAYEGEARVFSENWSNTNRRDLV